MKRHRNILSHWGEWSNFFESLSGRVKYGTHNGATYICTLLQRCFEEANGKRSADLSLETQQNSPEKLWRKPLLVLLKVEHTLEEDAAADDSALIV
jgi:hypothetical protein